MCCGKNERRGAVNKNCRCVKPVSSPLRGPGTTLFAMPSKEAAAGGRAFMEHGVDTVMDYLRVCVPYRLTSRCQLESGPSQDFFLSRNLTRASV
jgi:hypothetical protein